MVRVRVRVRAYDSGYCLRRFLRVCGTISEKKSHAKVTNTFPFATTLIVA